MHQSFSGKKSPLRSWANAIICPYSVKKASTMSVREGSMGARSSAEQVGPLLSTHAVRHTLQSTAPAPAGRGAIYWRWPRDQRYHSPPSAPELASEMQEYARNLLQIPPPESDHACCLCILSALNQINGRPSKMGPRITRSPPLPLRDFEAHGGNRALRDFVTGPLSCGDISD